MEEREAGTGRPAPRQVREKGCSCQGRDLSWSSSTSIREEILLHLRRVQGAQGLNNPLVRSLSPSRGPVGTLPTGPAPWCEGPTEQGDRRGARPRPDPNPEQRGSVEWAQKWWGVQAVGVGGHCQNPRASSGSPHPMTSLPSLKDNCP